MSAAEVSRADEAKNLAKDAVEAIEHGDKEEGKFLADAAKELDKKAADSVLKDNGSSGDKA